MKIVRSKAGRKQAGVPPIYISKMRMAFEPWLNQMITSFFRLLSILSNGKAQHRDGMPPCDPGPRRHPRTCCS